MHSVKVDHFSWCLVCDDAVFTNCNNLFTKIRPRCLYQLDPPILTLLNKLESHTAVCAQENLPWSVAKGGNEEECHTNSIACFPVFRNCCIFI